MAVKQKRSRKKVGWAPPDDAALRLERREALVGTVGVTNSLPDGQKMSKSRRKKRRLLASQGTDISFGSDYRTKGESTPSKKTKRLLSKFKAKQRALANTSVTGQARPLSKLDEQAKELGVYSEAYHNLNRVERKALVSKAYSAAKAAA